MGATPDRGWKIIFVDATAMQNSLIDTGCINLYCIQFDPDRDVVKSKSQPKLDEMTKLMRKATAPTTKTCCSGAAWR